MIAIKRIRAFSQNFVVHSGDIAIHGSLREVSLALCIPNHGLDGIIKIVLLFERCN